MRVGVPREHVIRVLEVEAAELPAAIAADHCEDDEGQHADADEGT
jgi:hypothetical protein